MKTVHNDQKAFSGRKRARTTRPAVKMANTVARTCITVGGGATILSVLLVGVFLFSVIVPLFLSPESSKTAAYPLPVEQKILLMGVNEYQTMGWVMTPDGTIRLFVLQDGREIASFHPLAGRAPTAASFNNRDGKVVFGFADGSVQYGVFSFATDFLEKKELSPGTQAIPIGTAFIHDNGMVERTPEGQFRLQRFHADLLAPVTVEQGQKIIAVDLTEKPSGPVIAAVTAANTLFLNEIQQTENMLTGEVTVELAGGSIPLDPTRPDAPPYRLFLTGQGDNVLLAWEDGTVHRYDTRSFSRMTLAESVDVVPGPDDRLTAVDFLIGKTTLVTGDSAGRVTAWFRVKLPGTATVDGARLVAGHELDQNAHGVAAIAASPRSRMLSVGYTNGSVSIYNITSERLVAEFSDPTSTALPANSMTISPKDNGMVVIAGKTLGHYALDIPHHEVTLSSIYTPVWYEGYNMPEQVWQSSSGTDDFEPKYGLYPLIFGTVKATIYSMLFGVPLAILAAVYTSELMHPKLRSKVKSTIEIMASLPSVVLGFLAALVVAPFVEDIIPQVLSTFYCIPFALLFGGFLWQLLPRTRAAAWTPYRLLAMFAMVLLGIWLGFLAGGALEHFFFSGDFRQWLATKKGSPFGGWFLLFLPFSTLVVALFPERLLDPVFRCCRPDSIRGSVSPLSELLRFLIATLLVVALAGAVAYIFSHGPMGLWSLDLRGWLFDTYVQRNALVVGFMMGFAIIPIIYTISEDALSTVPEYLRSASLAAGATPWQTAVRIILPTAASGIFSAVMIGFGRAVGETMIVLMAAGNTPLMDWNIFNGFRTLSANIAVELPEAVQNSTHYRMLFLAAFNLFIMTFFLNTLAEIIRQRFRKRAFEL